MENIVPLAGGVNGVGGVGYGARGTGIVKLTEVVKSTPKISKAYCFNNFEKSSCFHLNLLYPEKIRKTIHD